MYYMHGPNAPSLCAYILYSRSFFYLFGMANNCYTRGASWCIVAVSGTIATSEKVIYSYVYVIIWYFKGKKMKVDILIWPDIMMVNCEDSYNGYGLGACIILYPHALASVTFKTIECQNIRDEHKTYVKQDPQKNYRGLRKKMFWWY